MKQCISALAAPLANIYNASFAQGIFPEALKLAIVKPLFKKGDQEEIGNYRPVSMLSVFSKILETLMYNRLLAFLNRSAFFHDFQHGFVKNKSTTTALVNFMDTVLSALDGREAVCGLFLDLSRAFDTLNHTCLLNKLEKMGIRGSILKWFASYLGDRTQKTCIMIDKTKYESDVLSYNHGVPQGSVLGPLLFIVFLNDIVSCVNDSDKINIINYADDTNLIIKGGTIGEIQQYATQTWGNLKDWFYTNQLILNEAKSNCIFFKTHNSTFHTPDHLTKEIPISVSNNTKLLGVIVDSKCKWMEHIDDVIKKVKQKLFCSKNLITYF